MMRKNLPGLLACFVCVMGSMTAGVAQERCGSMPAMDNIFKRNPSLKSSFQVQTQNIREAFLKRKALAPTLRVEGTTIYIPVVFHIVLQNPNQVTDAQIQAQIDRLNIDYSGTNADSTLIPVWFKPFFAKPNIQFKLAQRNFRDEPSDGIERITTQHFQFLP